MTQEPNTNLKLLTQTPKKLIILIRQHIENFGLVLDFDVLDSLGFITMW